MSPIPVITEDTYVIRHYSEASKPARVLTIDQDGVVKGHSPHDWAEQAWIVKRKPGTEGSAALYSIQSVQTGQYLGYGDAAEQGASAKGQATPCYWALVHRAFCYRIRVPEKAYALEIANKYLTPPENVEVNLVGDGLDTDEDRRWEFIPSQRIYPIVGGDYIIRCKLTQTVITNSNNSNQVGNPIVASSDTKGDDQVWKLTIKRGTDHYELRCVENGIALGTADTVLSPDTSVATLQANPLYFQIRPVDIFPGCYRLMVPGTKFTLDVRQGSVEDGAQLLVYPCQGVENQYFTFERR